MNIEESIEILKNSKKLYLKEKIDSDILEEAIEILLAAYEKEKEKNKKLTERVLRLESDKFWNNVVSKDKIKAKIEELEKQDKESRFSKNYLVIHVLQSLLEEEEYND